MSEPVTRASVSSVFLVSLGVAAMAFGFLALARSAAPVPPPGNDVFDDAKDLVTEGRQTFRFDTFGDEAFWGGQLHLHDAIKGAALGGVGPGLTPTRGARARAEGRLRVARTRRRRTRSRTGTVDLDDPAVTVELLRQNAVVGVTGFFENDQLVSVGIQCALCHSTVDDSLAPGIGKRLDGWANRDLDVGAIVALAPDLTPFTTLLSLTDQQVRDVLNSWGPGQVRRRARPRRPGVPADGLGGDADSARLRAGRREPPHVDRLGLGHALERVRREPRDARRRAPSTIRGSTTRCSSRSPRPTASAT